MFSSVTKLLAFAFFAGTVSLVVYTSNSLSPEKGASMEIDPGESVSPTQAQAQLAPVPRGYQLMQSLSADPCALCSPATVQLDANGTATLQASDVDNSSSGTNTPLTLTVNPNTFDCDDIIQELFISEYVEGSSDYSTRRFWIKVQLFSKPSPKLFPLVGSIVFERTL